MQAFPTVRVDCRSGPYQFCFGCDVGTSGGFVIIEDSSSVLTTLSIFLRDQSKLLVVKRATEDWQHPLSSKLVQLLGAPNLGANSLGMICVSDTRTGSCDIEDDSTPRSVVIRMREPRLQCLGCEVAEFTQPKW
jgi:hypothetical protein